MKKNQHSNEYENMGSKDIMHYDKYEHHMAEAKQEGKFFEFLYNLKAENPWDEKDFNSVFMYL